MIRKIDFSDELGADLEARATALRLSLSQYVNLICQGLLPALDRPLTGPCSAPIKPAAGPDAGSASLSSGVGSSSSSEPPLGGLSKEREQPALPAAAPVKRDRRRPLVPPPAPPDELDSVELRKALRDFSEYRQVTKKNPMTARAWTVLLNGLAAMHPSREDAPAAVLYAMARGWLTVDPEYFGEVNWSKLRQLTGLSPIAAPSAPGATPLHLQDANCTCRRIYRRPELEPWEWDECEPDCPMRVVNAARLAAQSKPTSQDDGRLSNERAILAAHVDQVRRWLTEQERELWDSRTRTAPIPLDTAWQTLFDWKKELIRIKRSRAPAPEPVNTDPLLFFRTREAK